MTHRIDPHFAANPSPADAFAINLDGLAPEPDRPDVVNPAADSPRKPPRLEGYLITSIHWLLAFIAFMSVRTLYPEELDALWQSTSQTVGPTFIPLLAFAAYLLAYQLRTVWMLVGARGHTPVLTLYPRIDHAEDVAEVAGVTGLLGTVLAMTTAGASGTPDLAQFLQSLLSTLIGSGMMAATMLIASFMRRALMEQEVRHVDDKR